MSCWGIVEVAMSLVYHSFLAGCQALSRFFGLFCNLYVRSACELERLP